MLALAIDTSTNLCAVCIYDASSKTILAEQSLDIGRGHAEILMEMIEECMTKADVQFNLLERIIATIGPGSFTGVRVGLAAARGLGLALETPVIGVSTLDACEAIAKQSCNQAKICSVLDARRGEAYFQIEGQKPFISAYENFDSSALPQNCKLSGSGAGELNAALNQNFDIIHTDATAPIALIAEIGTCQIVQEHAPEPLYLRGADAKPQAGFAIERA